MKTEMQVDTFSLVPKCAQGPPHDRLGELGKLLSYSFYETHTKLPFRRAF